MEYRYHKHRLYFKIPGGTSRGVLSYKDSWFLMLRDQDKIGIGECSIIEGLSQKDAVGFKMIDKKKPYKP